MWLILSLAVVLGLAGPYLIPAQYVTDPAALAEPDGFFVQVDGVRIYGRALGPEDGEPVLLVHGFGGSTFSWRHTLKALAEAGYRAIAFDRPPFGLSAKQGAIDYSAGAQVELVAALMDTLNIGRATLVGHSAGGGLVLRFAVRHPARVTRLVVVDGAFGGSGGPAGMVGALLRVPPVAGWARVAVRLLLTPARFEQILASAYHDPAHAAPDVLAGYAEPLYLAGWDEGLVGMFRDAGGAPPDLEALARSDTPMLLMWGEEDTWVSIEEGRALHAQLPGADWVAYTGAGHLPMEESPEMFHRDLLNFLRAH